MHEQRMRWQAAVDRREADRQRQEPDEPQEREHELRAPPVDPSPARRTDLLGRHGARSYEPWICRT